MPPFDCKYLFPTPSGKALLQVAFASNPIIIVPTLSIGNVSQLAIDAILSNLGPSAGEDSAFKLVGYYHDDFSLEPFIAASFEENIEISPLLHSVNLNMELFYNPTSNILIIQQRCGIIAHRMKAFCKDFFPFLKSFNPSEVLMLTSLSNLYRSDDELSNFNNDGSMIEWFTIDSVIKLHPKLENIERPHPMLDDSVEDPNYDYELEEIVSGSTFTPAKPPKAAFDTKSAQILQKMNIPYTNYHRQYVLDHKHFKKIKAKSNYSLLYADGEDKNNEKKEKSIDTMEDETDQKKPYVYFPFPVKGGGICFRLAKYARTHDVTLTGLVSFNAKGDTRRFAVGLMRVVAEYISLKNDDKQFLELVKKIDEGTFSTPAVWKHLFEGQ